ncbi:hypothetical protein NPIL_494451 [Nephila pilipes]|uniref:Uncharacterized protein n=1 Tax=Nephila pilipes TaxID=299642 RepID=A0A8X6U916_NEPPI|nr:hypothetical protein NPIL_494451 [Nephila pilipes]
MTGSHCNLTSLHVSDIARLAHLSPHVSEKFCNSTLVIESSPIILQFRTHRDHPNILRWIPSSEAI